MWLKVNNISKTNRIFRKTLAIFVAGVFLFNSCVAGAQNTNLAPKLQVTDPEFKEKFQAKTFLLAHDAVNEYITNYAGRIIEKAEKIKKVQELEAAVEALEPYMKK